jgi:hypothetical protein
VIGSNRTNEKLDTYQAWSSSEVMGIGRKGKAAGLMEGDVKQLCVFADYSRPTWSHLRSRDVMTTYRSIKQMGDHTLPKTALIKRGNKNVLVDNLLTKLRGGKTTPQQDTNKLDACISLNSVKKSWRLRWKHRMRKTQKSDYEGWMNNMQSNLHKTTARRMSRDLDDPVDLKRHINAFEIGTSYIMHLKNTLAATKSITHLDSMLPSRLKVPLRQIKSGQIPFTRVMKHMYDLKWSKQALTEKHKSITCPCGQGIQDTQHALTGCGITEHLLRQFDEKLEQTLVAAVADESIQVQFHREMEMMSSVQRLAAMVQMPHKQTMPSGHLALAKQCGTGALAFLEDIEALHKQHLSEGSKK